MVEFWKARIRSFRFAWQGMRYLARETHGRMHLVATVLVLFSGWWLEVSRNEWFWLIACIGWVLAAELLNSAIERLIDWIHPDYHKEAGAVKDMAAGFVLLLCIAAAIIGGWILFPKWLDWLLSLR